MRVSVEETRQMVGEDATHGKKRRRGKRPSSFFEFEADNVKGEKVWDMQN